MNMQMRARLKAVRLDRNAFQISVIYLLIGGLWILFSDRFAEAISKNVQTLTTVSTYKGWGYVLITGLILYWLIHSNNSRLQKENEELQAAEKNYKDIFDHATVGIYRSTPDGRLLTVNSALAAMFGYTSPDEMLASINDIGSQVYKISARRAEYQNTITEQGFIKEFVNEERRKDGSWIWTSTNAHSIQDDAGNILYYEGFTIDVTERNQAEEKLLASEIQYRRLFEAAKDGILILNADTGEIVDVNPFLEEMLGYSQAEFLGKQLWEIGLFKDIVANKAAFLKLQEEGYVRYENLPLETRNGQPIWVEFVSNVYDVGKRRVVQCNIRNITERKRAEKALNESEKHFHSLFDHMLEGYAYCEMIYENDRPSDFIYREVNDAFEKLTGITKAVGRKVSEIIPGIRESNPELLEIYGKAARTGESKKFETYVDELKIWFSVSVYSVEKDRFVAVFDNITERKHTEESITESNRQLKALVTSLDDIVFEVDSQGTYLNVWTADESLLSEPKAELIGRQIEDTLQKETADSIMEATQRVLKANDVEEIEYPLILPSGLHWFLARISPITSPNGNSQTVSMLVRDITERKAAQEVMRLRLAELELVHQSGLELSRVLEPEEIAQRIIAQMEKHLNWHHSAVRLYDPESQILKVIGFNVPGLENEIDHDGLEEHFNLLVQKWDDGLTGWAVQHDQTLRIGDLSRDHRYTETFPGLNSGLYVPIKTDNRILGVISVENEAPDAFSELDESLLNTLANQAAIALENSRLHKETQQRLNQLQALHAIDFAITNSLDLNITLDILINQVMEQTGVDAAAIFLLQPDINNLKYVLGKGFRTYLLEKLSHSASLNESLAGRAILEGRVIVSLAMQETKNDLREIWEAEGFHSIYTFPLVTKGEPKGVMKVFYRSEVKARTPDWMSFIETLAGQAAIAIENIRLFEGLQRSNMELAIAYDATIEGWSRAMDLRDEETEGHTQRVVNTTLKLASDFDFPDEMLMNIRRGALLHDIGKLGVPDRILLKPGKLTDEEWNIMKKHPTFAFEMLAPIEYLNQAINIPYCHHEKWDGTGYPRGISGEQIPLEARIFAVVDVWDAITSDRPYRKAWPKEKAVDYIRSLAGSHFDAAIVEKFLELQKKERQQ